jgi:hypothetical protein
LKSPERLTIKLQRERDNSQKSLLFAIAKDSWGVNIDLLREVESCHGHSIYTLDPSPATKGLLLPMNKLTIPGPSAPELVQFYGYFEFIKYEKKDYLIINGRQINFESYKIKRNVLVRIGS